MSRPHTRRLRDAITLMRASKILDDVAAGKHGPSKYSEQWLDQAGYACAEVAKDLDPSVKSLTTEEEPS